MKTIIMNGSPGKDWNTARMLKEAQKGAELVGPETEYMDLYDLSYDNYSNYFTGKVNVGIILTMNAPKAVYNKYNMAGFNEDHKKAMREKQFPEDLKNAFTMGEKPAL